MEKPFDVAAAERSVNACKIGPALLHLDAAFSQQTSPYNRMVLLMRRAQMLVSYALLDLAAMTFDQVVREVKSQGSPPELAPFLEVATAQGGHCWGAVGQRTTDTALRPKMLLQEVSSRCNYACRKCLHRTMKRPQIDLDPAPYGRFLERWSLLFGEFAEITYGGGGEVLMHPRIVEIQQLTRRHMPHSRVTLLTNGALVRRDLAMELIENGLINWEISLDTVDAEEYARQMGRDTLALVLGNVKTLWELLEQGKRGSLTVRSHGVFDDTYQETMGAVWRKLWEMGVGCDWTHYPLMTLMKRNDEEGLDRWEETLDWKTPLSGGACGEVVRKLVVMADGRVRRCCGDIFDCPEEETLGNA
ncbi:MAG TPA: radical SAM protein, partial [Synergistaceae bacterium]|nr:radical SAM protein [Synergistaceae bacterium]